MNQISLDSGQCVEIQSMVFHFELEMHSDTKSM